MEREGNWRDAFLPVLGTRKDIISSTLSELEPIRNRLAHNRKATNKDVDIVKGAYSKLETAIGSDYFNELAVRCSCAEDIIEQIINLSSEADRSFCICNKFAPLEKSEVWASIQKEWWFDESYLGHKIDGINEFFEAIEEYTKIPRERGSGHRVELWVKNSGIECKYNIAKSEFSALI